MYVCSRQITNHGFHRFSSLFITFHHFSWYFINKIISFVVLTHISILIKNMSFFDKNMSKLDENRYFRSISEIRWLISMSHIFWQTTSKMLKLEKLKISKISKISKHIYTHSNDDHFIMFFDVFSSKMKTDEKTSKCWKTHTSRGVLVFVTFCVIIFIKNRHFWWFLMIFDDFWHFPNL